MRRRQFGCFRVFRKGGAFLPLEARQRMVTPLLLHSLSAVRACRPSFLQ